MVSSPSAKPTWQQPRGPRCPKGILGINGPQKVLSEPKIPKGTPLEIRPKAPEAATAICRQRRQRARALVEEATGVFFWMEESTEASRLRAVIFQLKHQQTESDRARIPLTLQWFVF